MTALHAHPDRPRALGFAARLGLATSLLIAVVCTAQSWILSAHDVQGVRRYLEDRGRTVVEQLAREAAPSMGTGSLDGLYRLAEQARTRSGVTYTRFFDAHGLLLVSVGSAPPGAPLAQAAPRDAAKPIPVGADTWEFRSPITSLGPSSVLGGAVAIGLPLESLHAIRLRTLGRSTPITVLFTLAGVAAAVALARAITRPLEALARAADAIARGDFAARVGVESRDEVGALARSFNAMAGSLARSRTILEEKVKELEEANRLKSEFLTTVSHELRTPLNVIIGYASMLAEGGLGTEQAEMVAAIERYSKRQLDLVTTVLDFSRVSSGDITCRAERFPLGPLLEEIAAPYAARMRDGRIRLGVDVAPEVPELVTDRSKVQEIVRNLVDNAVKFTTAGSVTVSARPGDRAGWVRIEVADTGSGIRPEHRDCVFDAFRQIGESSTRGTGGVGLGLSMVKGLVDALGGTVSIASSTGGGSTFHVDLPSVLPGTPPGERALPAAVQALDDVTRNVTKLAEKTRPLGSTGGSTRPRRADGRRPEKTPPFR